MKNIRLLSTSLARRRAAVAALPVAVLASTASAQTGGVSYAPMVTAITNGMTGVLNEAGPLLFGLMALIGGFYFVWGRIRSLW